MSINFNKLGAGAQWVYATKMLEEMRNDVKTMMSWKAKTITNIRDTAELAVMKYTYDPDMKIDYYSAKDPRTADGKPMKFYPHKNYGNTAINTNYSVVHVPTNVYDQSPDVLNAIKWSGELNTVFRNNLAYDSSLIFQFFGSATGFLRLYPAIKWRAPVGPDMYDCRMRPWLERQYPSPNSAEDDTQKLTLPKELFLLLAGLIDRIFCKN
ncbi:hypothetical protein TNCT_555021 [Trichonephila clavata]|uniref:VWA N-terminal domain-containing protein n=1 Tax=Trichonephila clavata TaxID=2740835 RepID=A0A8X6FVP9_TRICU|nr:hypothetical protein TNCT_555021 [Trichonephila clavata]